MGLTHRPEAVVLTKKMMPEAETKSCQIHKGMASSMPARMAPASCAKERPLPPVKCTGAKASERATHQKIPSPSGTAPEQTAPTGVAHRGRWLMHPMRNYAI